MGDIRQRYVIRNNPQLNNKQLINKVANYQIAKIVFSELDSTAIVQDLEDCFYDVNDNIVIKIDNISVLDTKKVYQKFSEHNITNVRFIFQTETNGSTYGELHLPIDRNYTSKSRKPWFLLFLLFCLIFVAALVYWLNSEESIEEFVNYLIEWFNIKNQNKVLNSDENL